MPLPEKFSCVIVREPSDDASAVALEEIAPADLPPGEVTVRVAWSSLNYKDALACCGHPGVVRRLPHVPGIDCAGTVVSSDAADYRAGDEVLITGRGLGSDAWGGLAEFVRVPADWVLSLPEGLSQRESMILGTAGFTAAQAVLALQRAGVSPADGPIAVTGTTGGVGSLSVALLTKLGYNVTAVTGKRDRHDWLRQLGAAEVIDRGELHDTSDRPLLTARWAGAIDVVGGGPLATLLRSTQHRGCVAACGLTAGDDLPLTVYPFILRGVTLAGIDSAKCPLPERIDIWRRLAGPWRLDQLDAIAQEVTLADVPACVRRMLAGEMVGRTVVRIG